MLHGRRLTVFLILAVLALPFLGLNLFGQDKDKDKDKEKKTPKDPTKVTLAWKFEKDKTFYQTMTTKTTQTMKVMSNDVTQNQEQTFYFSWKWLKDEGGKWEIEQTILGVKMDIDIGGSPIKYDSTTPATNNTSNPLSEFFKALVGSKFKLTLDPKTLKITKIEGRDEFLKKLVTANKQMQPLLEKILSDDALRQMAEPTFAVISNDAVEKGKTWKKESKLDMGPIGTYKNEYTYTYEGPDTATKFEKIKVDTKLTYSPPEKADGVGGLPFKIKSADLASKNATGNIWFNKDKGRVEKTEMSLDLEGKLKIEIGGQPTDVELKQNQKTSVTTSDTNPVEKAAPGK
ncbi:MAG TPA: DUF6263 family protein [Gemmataceae bacterium]|nr:DUF6263 family protein [Gemmataceae bacterium]